MLAQLIGIKSLIHLGKRLALSCTVKGCQIYAKLGAA
jgi:hypothetical protein